MYANMKLTGFLALLAGAAMFVAPQLGSTAEPEPTYEAEDLCVSVGKWECCYKEDE